MTSIKLNLKSLYDEIFGEPITHPFFRRLLAFGVDLIIVFSVNLLNVGLYFIANFQLGYLNTLILNLLVGICYFGIMNSKIAKGQTLGKKIFYIKVADENGNPITVLRSLLRSIPIVLIINWVLIAQAMHEIENNIFVHIIYGLLIFLFGIIYFSTFSLNRQGVHDLIFSTQVVTKDSSKGTSKNLTLLVVLGYLVAVGVFILLIYQD